MTGLRRQQHVEGLAGHRHRAQQRPLRLLAERLGAHRRAGALGVDAVDPHLATSAGSLLLFTSSSYTRGRKGYSLYSSAKAAVVNLTQALADEWAGEVRVNCVNPERTGTPMRTKAFGEEPEGTLLSSMAVARQSLDVLLSRQTGHIFDIRREDGPAAIGGGS